MSASAAAKSADPVNYPTITVDQFGRDHWSMLAYVESCCVDGSAGLGTMSPRRLRAHPERHPLQAHLSHWDAAWGTRLQGLEHVENFSDNNAALRSGLKLAQHDDWDCLDDLEEAGFVETFSRANCAVKMTPAGQRMAGELRTHKSGGGTFSNFVRQAPNTTRERARA